MTLTDVPGKTIPEIVRKLIGSNLRETSSPIAGRSIALHAARSPFLSDDIFDPSILQEGTGKALRVFSRRREDGSEGGLIGYWNVRSANGVVRGFSFVSLLRWLVLAAAYSGRSLGRRCAEDGRCTHPCRVA